MSERGKNPRTASRQSRPRRKGTPRGGRHGLSRSVQPIELGEGIELVEVAPSTASPRRQRAGIERLAPALAISREVEMAYIRSDMRRLFVISGVLLVLMLLILFVVER